MWESLKKTSWSAAHLGLEAGKGAFGVNVSSLCQRLGMSRQNYYAQRRRREREQVDGGLIEQLVKRERKVQPRLGGRKLHHILSKELAQAGVELGRDRFFKVLEERNLLLESQPAEYPCTTHSQHYLPVFTNKIKDLELTGANQVWVSDITYVRTWEGWLYLAVILDAFSRRVVGWALADHLRTELGHHGQQGAERRGHQRNRRPQRGRRQRPRRQVAVPAPPEQRDAVSSRGWGIGYIGGVAAYAVAIAMGGRRVAVVFATMNIVVN